MHTSLCRQRVPVKNTHIQVYNAVDKRKDMKKQTTSSASASASAAIPVHQWKTKGDFLPSHRAAVIVRSHSDSPIICIPLCRSIYVLNDKCFHAVLIPKSCNSIPRAAPSQLFSLLPFHLFLLLPLLHICQIHRLHLQWACSLQFSYSLQQ